VDISPHHGSHDGSLLFNDERTHGLVDVPARFP
jgi:hypothetical protein